MFSHIGPVVQKVRRFGVVLWRIIRSQRSGSKRQTREHRDFWSLKYLGNFITGVAYQGREHSLYLHLVRARTEVEVIRLVQCLELSVLHKIVKRVIV